MKNEEYIDINKIAELKGLKSNRSLRLAIQKGKYIAREVKVFGGKSYEILYSSLEPEIQEILQDELIKEATQSNCTALFPLNSILKGLFKLAPTAAIKYFKKKGQTYTWDWYELWQDAHKKTFTVAKVMREDILKDIRSALDKALEEGKTFQEFQKELKPTLQKKGWWGEQIVVDTQGNAEKVQLGSMYRLKTIITSIRNHLDYQNHQ